MYGVRHSVKNIIIDHSIIIYVYFILFLLVLTFYIMPSSIHCKCKFAHANAHANIFITIKQLLYLIKMYYWKVKNSTNDSYKAF